MNIQKRFIIGLIGLAVIFFAVSPVLAAEPSGLQISLNKLKVIGGAYGENPKTMAELVGGVIQTALALLGVIFLVLTVYGGYKWMIARGDPKEVETAKDIITRAVMGLIVILAAYAITYFVVFYLTRAAGITT